MDPERVEILHVTDRDAVVVAVANHLIFNLFPAFERLLDENLRGEGEGLLADFLELLLSVAESGSQAAKGVGSPDDQRETEIFRRGFRFLDIRGRVRFDRLDTDLVEFLYEEVAVLGVHDRLHRSTKHIDSVFLQRAFLVQLDTAIQRRLAAE